MENLENEAVKDEVSIVLNPQNLENSSFYTETATENDFKVHISISGLINFWQNSGFRKLKLPKGGFDLVKIERKSILTSAHNEDLMHAVKDKLLKKDNKPKVWEHFLKGEYITKKANLALDYMSDLKLNICDRNTAYFYFQNGVLKVTDKDMKLIDYEEFEGFVSESQIIQHDFILPVGSSIETKSMFDTFLKNVTGKNEARYQYLTSCLGYLLHGYKDPSFTKAVILVDEQLDFSGEANGGTGKSIISKAIEEMTSSLQKDGKSLHNKGNRFFYQDLTAYHRILILDDVNPEFNFEDYYSVVTGEMTVEEKYKANYKIPFELSPKLLISSNYMVQGSGGNSDDRRRLEVEISPYYSRDFTPIDDFGCVFFQDWSTEEWNCFYTDMVSYCQGFIRNGIKECKPINLAENKLKIQTDISFVDFADLNIIFPEESTEITKNKTELYNVYRENYPVESRTVTNIKFKKWLDLYGKSRNYIVDHKKSDGNVLVTFTKIQK